MVTNISEEYLQSAQRTQHVSSFAWLVTTYVMLLEGRAEIVLQYETDMPAQNVQMLCNFIFVTVACTSYWPLHSYYYYLHPINLGMTEIGLLPLIYE